LYQKETRSNSTPPRSDSGASAPGWSTISGRESTSEKERSAEAMACCISEKTRARSCTGQSMKVTYPMKAWMVPIETVPATACDPPNQATVARATAPIPCTIGRKSAESQAARYPAPYISSVRARNSRRFRSSRPRALITRTPVMVSLKEAVIFEFTWRTFRYWRMIRCLKYAPAKTSTGMVRNTRMASFHCRYSMKHRADTMLIPAQVKSSRPQVTRSATLAGSEVTRDMIHPTGVRSK
jgi:hypothetical protein